MEGCEGGPAPVEKAPGRAPRLRLRITCSASDRQAEEAWNQFLIRLLRNPDRQGADP